MRLVLIRHRLTDYNLKRRYCGIKDIGLNKIGRAEAGEIKTKIKGLKVDAVFCSDLKRSWQTAKIIFGTTGCRIIKNPNLREINFGNWEGLTSNQILKRFPSTYKKWLRDPFAADIPHGQNLYHFTSKIKNELKKMVKANLEQTVALVIHSGPIRVILNTVLGIKRKDFWRLKINPDAIYIIEYKGHLKPEVYTLKNG